MAQEELRHAALFRSARRRAFHAERHRLATEAVAAGNLPAELPRQQPADEAARVERALAGLLSALADEATRGESAAVAGRADSLRRLSRESADMASEAAAAAAAEIRAEATSPTHPAHRRGAGGALSWVEVEVPRDGLSGALGLAERTAEDYLAAADAARDEAGVRRLQSLAERAIARIALLREIATPP
jgi:hypothetical protein